LTEADEKVRREKPLEFLNGKEPAWRDEDRTELKNGAVAWVRKIRSEWRRRREGEKD